MLLSDYGKSETQDITGQLPILLSALCRINLDFPGGGETPGGDIYASKLVIMKLRGSQVNDLYDSYFRPRENRQVAGPSNALEVGASIVSRVHPYCN